MKISAFVRIVLVVFAVCAVTLSCERKATEQGKRLSKVTFRLDWTPGAEHSFLYLAKKKGYFKEEGLDVSMQAGDGSTTSAKLVGNGSVDYALCSGDTALIAASAGTPIQVLAVLYSQPPTVIYSRKDRDIIKPKDLEGRKYGAYMKSTTYNQFLAFCSLTDVNLSKVQVVATAGKASDILTDAVDASAGYTYIQPIQCEVAGIPVNEMFVSDYGVNCYSMSIIGNKNTLNPEVTRHFLKASLRAFADMLTDNSVALEAFFEAIPTANKEFEHRKLKRLTEFVNKNLKTQGAIGAQTLNGWEQTQAFLQNQRLISTKLNLPDFFTTKFLPQP
jgi:ABC-type nitrate/sulfonate/bicarbonate transport system substrate-binding protein